ncbi:hypothetical protein [Novispirillum itersonii]|uniref:Uncharacterized protein n=1 Tax=Novispirillum itersonii TaxID=189 RepID=A0A7W9ZG08_NOVIT|nr:hypothetical protein [Novispirillum itersonii]MBB6210730.1 hypothetical protein [Novispirillum itersonii]
MAITSLLTYMNQTSSDDLYETLRNRQTQTVSVPQASINRYSKETGIDDPSASRFGSASSVSLSNTAKTQLSDAEKETLKAEALQRANAALSRAGIRTTATRQTRNTAATAETPRPKDDAPLADKVKYNTKLLEKTGPDGKALNQYIAKYFDGAQSKEGQYIQDRLQGLIMRMNNPTRDIQGDIVAQRANAKDGKQVFTLVGQDNTRLRIEFTTSADPKQQGALRVTYSGRDIGAVDMRLEKTPAVAPETQPILTASVEQKRILSSGRLDSTPIYDSKYSGPI